MNSPHLRNRPSWSPLRRGLLLLLLAVGGTVIVVIALAAWSITKDRRRDGGAGVQWNADAPARMSDDEKRALFARGPASVLPLLESPHARRRGEAVMIMGWFKDEQHLDALLRHAVTERNTQVRYAAIYSLRFIDNLSDAGMQKIVDTRDGVTGSLVRSQWDETIGVLQTKRSALSPAPNHPAAAGDSSSDSDG